MFLLLALLSFQIKLASKKEYLISDSFSKACLLKKFLIAAGTAGVGYGTKEILKRLKKAKEAANRSNHIAFISLF